MSGDAMTIERLQHYSYSSYPIDWRVDVENYGCVPDDLVLRTGLALKRLGTAKLSNIIFRDGNTQSCLLDNEPPIDITLVGYNRSISPADRWPTAVVVVDRGATSEQIFDKVRHGMPQRLAVADVLDKSLRASIFSAACKVIEKNSESASKDEKISVLTTMALFTEMLTTTLTGSYMLPTAGLLGYAAVRAYEIIKHFRIDESGVDNLRASFFPFGIEYDNLFKTGIKCFYGRKLIDTAS